MITVKPSPIHGNGVFATEDIPADIKIGELHGKCVTLEEAREAIDKSLVLHLRDSTYLDFYGSPDKLMFTNSSITPNAIMRLNPNGWVDFYSTQPISKDKEVTIWYQLK
jgi:hypothetical protein